MKAISLTKLDVSRGRMCAEVSIAQGARDTTPALAARALAEFPSLASHACVNEKGATFGHVIDNTPLPHLMEHLVIAYQMRATLEKKRPPCAKVAGDVDGIPAPAADFTYLGTSEWIDESCGHARITVNFADDLVALRAFRDAESFLNSIVVL